MVVVAKSSPWSLRFGRPQDRPVIRTITDEAFSVFGEYGSWLPDYVRHPGVTTILCESPARQIVGFAMLGVFESDGRGRAGMADLLAIAVAGPFRNQRVGTTLLHAAVGEARRLGAEEKLEEMHLTVAHDNAHARHLFGRFGFSTVPGDHGYYERGQRALRLRLPVHPRCPC